MYNTSPTTQANYYHIAVFHYLVFRYLSGQVSRIDEDKNYVKEPPIRFYDPHLWSGRTVTFFSVHEFVSSILRRALVATKTLPPFLKKRLEDRALEDSGSNKAKH